MTRFIKTKKRKTRRITKPCVILYDDREKHPWLFLRSYGWTMQKARLRTGDYTFKGYEKKFSIEKKSGLSELFTDLTARYRPTFKVFLHRLSELQVKAIVIEDDLSRVAQCVKILRSKSGGQSRLSEATMYYWISRITVDYRIPVLFTGGNLHTQCRLIHNLFTEAYNVLT